MSYTILVFEWISCLCLSDHKHARYLINGQSWDTDFAVYR